MREHRQDDGEFLPGGFVVVQMLHEGAEEEREDGEQEEGDVDFKKKLLVDLVAVGGKPQAETEAGRGKYSSR